MMTKDTVTRDIVVELINEFFHYVNEEQGEDFEDLEEDDVTQAHVNEMNADIRASQESNVPEIMWDVLTEEGIIPDDDDTMSEKFVAWYEQKHT